MYYPFVTKLPGGVFKFLFIMTNLEDAEPGKSV